MFIVSSTSISGLPSSLSLSDFPNKMVYENVSKIYRHSKFQDPT